MKARTWFLLKVRDWNEICGKLRELWCKIMDLSRISQIIFGTKISVDLVHSFLDHCCVPVHHGPMVAQDIGSPEIELAATSRLKISL
jgi:hypothetical protein